MWPGPSRVAGPEMNAGPWTGLRRRVRVPVPQEEQGIRANGNDDIRADGVARSAGAEERVRRHDYIRDACRGLKAGFASVVPTRVASSVRLATPSFA